MNRPDLIQEKIISLPVLLQRANRWRLHGKTIAFTNGVFDLLHDGHIFSLSQAAREANYLIVGLNTDASVKRLKGDSRPVNKQEARAMIMASLVIVDAVVLFDDDTPLALIKELLPDVLVKGGDYTVEQIAGSKEVIANGGRVVINPILEGISTTALIAQMKQ